MGLMEPLRYRVTLRILGPVLIFVTAGAALLNVDWLVVWAKQGHMPVGLLVRGIVASLIPAGSLMWLGNETVADEHGISIRRRLLGRASYPWPEIRSIDRDSKTGRVVIRTKENGRVWLPAPVALALGARGRHQAVADRVVELRRYGRAHGWHG
jgi:hypothetical protein